MQKETTGGRWEKRGRMEGGRVLAKGLGANQRKGTNTEKRADEQQEQEAEEEEEKEEEEAPVRCASAPPNAASPAVCAPQSA